MVACNFGFSAIAAALAKLGANMDLTPEVNGWTALMFASINCHTTTAAALVELGANKDLKDQVTCPL